MSDLHPVTQQILEHIDNDGLDWKGDESIDAIVRGAIERPFVAESGVRFPEMADVEVDVAANFILSGNQMQMLLVGTEPVLVVQPEFDAEANRVTLVTTTVDLPPAGLVKVLEALLDGAQEIVRIQQGA